MNNSKGMPARENLKLSFRIVCPLTELMSLGLGLADGRVYHENAQSLDLRRFSKLAPGSSMVFRRAQAITAGTRTS